MLFFWVVWVLSIIATYKNFTQIQPGCRFATNMKRSYSILKFSRRPNFSTSFTYVCGNLRQYFLVKNCDTPQKISQNTRGSPMKLCVALVNYFFRKKIVILLLCMWTIFYRQSPTFQVIPATVFHGNAIQKCFGKNWVTVMPHLPFTDRKNFRLLKIKSLSITNVRFEHS